MLAESISDTTSVVLEYPGFIVGLISAGRYLHTNSCASHYAAIGFGLLLSLQINTYRNPHIQISVGCSVLSVDSHLAQNPISVENDARTLHSQLGPDFPTQLDLSRSRTVALTRLRQTLFTRHVNLMTIHYSTSFCYCLTPPIISLLTPTNYYISRRCKKVIYTATASTTLVHTGVCSAERPCCTLYSAPAFVEQAKRDTRLPKTRSFPPLT